MKFILKYFSSPQPLVETCEDLESILSFYKTCFYYSLGVFSLLAVRQSFISLGKTSQNINASQVLKEIAENLNTFEEDSSETESDSSGLEDNIVDLDNQ